MVLLQNNTLLPTLKRVAVTKDMVETKEVMVVTKGVLVVTKVVLVTKDMVETKEVMVVTKVVMVETKVVMVETKVVMVETKAVMVVVMVATWEATVMTLGILSLLNMQTVQITKLVSKHTERNLPLAIHMEPTTTIIPRIRILS